MARAVATGLVCRWCRKPARFDGGAGLPVEEQRASHADTGRESCENGEHLAAPIDPDMARST